MNDYYKLQVSYRVIIDTMISVRPIYTWVRRRESRPLVGKRHSFIPSVVRTWNNLPEYIVCAPNYSSFRTPLRCFFC